MQIKRSHHTYFRKKPFLPLKCHFFVSVALLLVLQANQNFASDSEEIQTIITSQEQENETTMSPDVSSEIIQVAEQENEEGGCGNCQRELQQVQEQLQRMQREIENLKDFSIDKLLNVDKRTKIVIAAVRDNREEDPEVQKHLTFLQDHILEEKSLTRIAETILLSVLESENLTCQRIVSVFNFVVFDKVQLPVYEFLFDKQDSKGYFESIPNQKEFVKLFKWMMNRAKTRLAYISVWTKDTEIKLIYRLFTNLLNTIPSNDANWKSLSSWLNNEFYSLFLMLTEQEVYEVVLDTIESQIADKLLSYEQLQYLKYLFYSSSLRKLDMNNKRVPDINDYFSIDWDLRKNVFSRPLIFNSIDRDILSKITGNLTDAAIIGLKYLKEELPIEKTGYWGFSEKDIWFSHVADVFLHAIQNNVLTYDPNDSGFWKLINTFDDAKNILPKYPFLVDDIKILIYNKYENRRENFMAATEVLQGIPKSLILGGLKQLLSLMRENNHMNGKEVLFLGFLIQSINLRNNSVWNELPEQVQLLTDYTTGKGLILRLHLDSVQLTESDTTDASTDDSEDSPVTPIPPVKTEYEVYVNSDYQVSLGSVFESQGGNIDIPPQRIWNFDITGSQRLSTFKFTISLADVTYGGVVVSQDENGLQTLRHVKNASDRRHGRFAMFQLSLSKAGDSFQIQYGKDQYVSVLYDDVNGVSPNPIGLYLAHKGGNTDPKPINFIAVREP